MMGGWPRHSGGSTENHQPPARSAWARDRTGARGRNGLATGPSTTTAPAKREWRDVSRETEVRCWSQGELMGDPHYEHRSRPGLALLTNSSFMFHVKHVALCAPTRIRQEWLVRHRSAPAFRTRPSSRNGISSCPVTAPGYRCPPIPGQAPRHRYRRQNKNAMNNEHGASPQHHGSRALPPSK